MAENRTLRGCRPVAVASVAKELSDFPKRSVPGDEVACKRQLIKHYADPVTYPIAETSRIDRMRTEVVPQGLSEGHRARHPVGRFLGHLVCPSDGHSPWNQSLQAFPLVPVAVPVPLPLAVPELMTKLPRTRVPSSQTG